MTASEKEKAIRLLKETFGDKWQSVVQDLGTENLRTRVGKELTSFMAFPERGEGGKSSWRGNCSPKVVESVTKYVLDNKRFYGKDISNFTVIDPMSGSGTTKYAADKLGVRSVLYDLNPNAPCGTGGWNALKDDIDDSGDLIFFHPPYHSMITYSGNVWGNPHPDDLSRCASYKEFISKLDYVIKKLFFSLRYDGRLAVLVGDMKLNGKFYSMQDDMMKIGEYESFIVKGQFNCVSDTRRYSKPFIPIVTEYLLVFHKGQAPLIIPWSKQVYREFDASKKDDATLTWYHLIRLTMEKLGGKAKMSDLYEILASHPKAQANYHYKERIRATIYEHKEHFVPCGTSGCYELNYKIA